MTIKDVVGSVYGRMTILESLPRTTHNRHVLAQCFCGTTKKVLLGSLRSGATTSCGCAQREATTTHGLSVSTNRHPLYSVWAAMKGRCKSTANSNYGGRGITVCDEWQAFEPFLAWALASGYKVGLSLDREKNELGYSPSNCRWATETTQSRNRRSAKGSSSRYIGVYFSNSAGKWVAQITVNKKATNLGVHDTELAAAITRDQYIVDQGLSDFQMNNVL